MREILNSNWFSEYPEVFSVIVLILGLFLAKIVKKQTAKVITVLDRFASRYTTSESTVLTPELAALFQSAVYWLVVLFVALIAFRMWGGGDLSDWLDTTLSFVPRILIGILIIGVGHVLGLFSRFILSRLSENLNPSSSLLKIMHAMIFVIGVVLGLQHMLIDISFITQLLLISFLVLGGGLSFAFALGSKHYVANIVARSELDRLVVGDRIRIDNIEGEIVEKTATTIRLDTADGIVSVPCLRFLQTSVTQLRGG